MLQKLPDNYLPEGERAAVYALHQNHGRNQFTTPGKAGGPQLFQAGSKATAFASFPSPPPMLCGLRRRSRHGRPTARGVFRRHILPGLRACSCPWCLVSLSFASAFQPSQVKCVLNARKEMPCPKFTSGYPVFCPASFSPDP